MTMRPASRCAVEKRLLVLRDSDAVVIQAAARRVASEVGFDKQSSWEFAIAASEAATNILKYAGAGEIVLRGEGCCLELQALDRGAGIHDVEAVLRDGHSESRDLGSDRIVVNRRGLGFGLGAVKRLTDELSIAPRSGGGTILVARKYKKSTGA